MLYLLRGFALSPPQRVFLDYCFFQLQLVTLFPWWPDREKYWPHPAVVHEFAELEGTALDINDPFHS